MYIGKGSNGRDRIHLLPSSLNDEAYFHRKLRKLIRQGFDPQPIRLQTNLTEEEAFELEKFLIEQFGRKNLETGTLYNLTDGGDGVSGYRKTDEQLKARQMSDSREGKYKGVHEMPNGKCQARILDKRLGIFNTPEEAARAYDEAVIEHWGLDGHLNFPEEWDGLKCLREFVKRNSRRLSQQMRRSNKGRKYKGVYETRDGKYVAGISGKRLGTFSTPEEAARAYDEAVIEHWGLDGHLNFPNDGDYTGYWDTNSEHYQQGYLEELIV